MADAILFRNCVLEDGSNTILYIGGRIAYSRIMTSLKTLYTFSITPKMILLFGYYLTGATTETRLRNTEPVFISQGASFSMNTGRSQTLSLTGKNITFKSADGGNTKYLNPEFSFQTFAFA